MKRLISISTITALLIFAFSLSAFAFDMYGFEDGYFDNGEDSYLYIEFLNRAEGFQVSFSGDGDKIEMSGYADGNVIEAEDGGLKAVLTVIDNDTIKVTVNGAFRRAFSVDADGTYRRHYGK